MIQYGSRRWRAEGVGHTRVQGGVDALLHQNEDHLWLVVANVLKALDQLWYLVMLHHGHLTLRHTVSVDHNLLGETVVHLHQGQNPTVEEGIKQQPGQEASRLWRLTGVKDLL